MTTLTPSEIAKQVLADMAVQPHFRRSGEQIAELIEQAIELDRQQASKISSSCNDDIEETLAYFLCNEDNNNFNDSYEIRELYRLRACNAINVIGIH